MVVSKWEHINSQSDTIVSLCLSNNKWHMVVSKCLSSKWDMVVSKCLSSKWNMVVSKCLSSKWDMEVSKCLINNQ